MSSCVIDESALSLIPVTATPSTSSARAITSRPGVAAVRPEDQATPPSAAGTSVVPAEHIVAGPPCCDAALRVPNGNSNPPARSI